MCECDVEHFNNLWIKAHKPHGASALPSYPPGRGRRRSHLASEAQRQARTARHAETTTFCWQCSPVLGQALQRRAILEGPSRVRRAWRCHRVGRGLNVVNGARGENRCSAPACVVIAVVVTRSLKCRLTGVIVCSVVGAAAFGMSLVRGHRSGHI